MSGFTSDEIAESVDRFLLKQVEVPRLPTGSRDITVLRGRVFDLITTALLLKPDSYFYLVWLAKNRLAAVVSAQLASVASIQSAATGVSRVAKKVTSTAALTNARAALLELNAGLGARTTGVSGSIGPAVDRFRRNVERFIDEELSKNVVSAGAVVDTGDGVRKTVATAWAEVTGSRDELEGLAAQIYAAIDTLAAVRLPQSSVRDIVGRIQDRLVELEGEMAGSDAAAKSRAALLDLLTMRTVLTKASTFRTPELVLMPKSSDARTGVLVDSTGTEASIQGAVSGPFNFDPGTTFDFVINGAARSVVFSETSRAELRTRSFSFPEAGPTAPAEAAVMIDGVLGAGIVAPGPFATGADLAAAVDTALGGAGVVTFEASTSRLVIVSGSDDGAALRALDDTSDRQRFVEWAFYGAGEEQPIEAAGAPVSADVVAAEIAAADTSVRATVLRTSLASFTGTRSDAAGEEAVLWDLRDSGTDLVADGTDVVTSPTKNFEALGVRAGMVLEVTAPAGSVGIYGIVSVSGGTLVLGTTVAAAAAASYAIGPDYRLIPTGARVYVTGSVRENTGYYRVTASGSRVGRLDLDRALAAADDDLGTTVFSEYIRLQSIGTTTSSEIGVLAASTGQAALGFAATSATTKAGLTMFVIGSGDFLARGVREGDRILLTAPSSEEIDAEIAGVAARSVVLATPATYEAGAWYYEVNSSRYRAFENLRSDIARWNATSSAAGFASVDQAMTRLISGARYDVSIQAALATYAADLMDLKTSLELYLVPAEKAINNVIRTMAEQGFDRALDMLLALRIDELFAMHPDGVSYKTNLVRQIATTTREVAPVNKYAKSLQVVQEVRSAGGVARGFDPTSSDT